MAGEAVSGFLKVISLVSGVISITGFTKAQLPKDTPGEYDSIARVAVALSNPREGFRDGAGTAPVILAFNENQENIGISSYAAATNIPSGSYKDITVHQDVGPGQQATYLQVVALEDAVCVAYISQTWSDGTVRGWLGDMGAACGRDWYYSGIIVGNEHHKPYCTWIDLNHSNGLKDAALQIHMEDFAQVNTSELNADKERWCNYPTMLFKEHHNYAIHPHTSTKHDGFMPAVVNTAKPDKLEEYDIWTGPERGDWGLEPMHIKKRAVRNYRRDPMPVKAFKHLVASQHASHSAQKLCQSETSHGPDFVSLREGIFCDMHTKSLWPLCKGDKLDDDCYHWETQSLVIGAEWVAKNYTHVDEW